MNTSLAFVLLLASPPAIMAVSHVWAVRAQDRKTWCVVVLDNRVRSVEAVVASHRAQHKISVVQVWDAKTKGYRAHIPVKHVSALQADHRVRFIESWEQDDFLGSTR